MLVRQHRDDQWRSHGNITDAKGMDQQSISDEISTVEPWNPPTDTSCPPGPLAEPPDLMSR